jgi:hypothetical protein
MVAPKQCVRCKLQRAPWRVAFHAHAAFAGALIWYPTLLAPPMRFSGAPVWLDENIPCEGLEPLPTFLHNGNGAMPGLTGLDVSDNSKFASVRTPNPCTLLTFSHFGVRRGFHIVIPIRALHGPVGRLVR